MSLILTSAAGLGAFYLVGDHVNKNNAAMAKKRKAAQEPVQVTKRQLYTGRYGNISEYSDNIDPTLIRSIQVDRDLSGVPMRWIEMNNGAVYQTYDMEYPQIQ